VGTRTSALSVPAALLFAVEAIRSAQPLLIALGVILLIVTAGYLSSEIQLRRTLRTRSDRTATGAEEPSAVPVMRDLALSRPSLGERVFPAVYISATIAILVLLAFHAFSLPAR
jgi:hypothetical protein